jgi:uncharacterized protein YbbC (DUF1343 family)
LDKKNLLQEEKEITMHRNRKVFSISVIFILSLIICLNLSPIYSKGKAKKTSKKHFIGKVIPGIDVLANNNFDLIKGKKVGLITNHTGLSRNGISDIDILFDTKECKLIALFGPEHGIRGTADEKVASGKDTKTGLPVYSLYGKNKKPSKEMLKDIDVLIFDIQDIGTRFYTYIGTMANTMKAAKENDIEFMVLDRPNPVGGKVEGAVATEDLCGKNTCIYPIPTRHGMTVGELAQLFNDHFKIGCKLEVIPMKNWERWMHYDETGLMWIDPSPNMKTLNGAILYPGLGISETTKLSCGRGTDRPFEMYGAPYIDKDKLAANLAKRKTPGLRFVPYSFIPTAKWHKFKGELCHGIFAIIYDRDILDSVTAGLHLIQAIHELNPEKHLELGGFKTETGDKNTWKMLTEDKKTPEEIVKIWEPQLKEFKKLSKKYYLYK